MGRYGLLLVAIWLAAANLRAAIFALQPVLPELRRDLGLSFSASGGLASMSLLVLGLASLPALYVGSWLGARRAVGLMAVGIAIASVARLAPPESVMVFVGSGLVAAFAAFSQPAATVLLRRWFAADLHRASGMYSNGILIGGTVGASVTPLLVVISGWRGTFWAWSLLSLLVAALWWRITPRGDVPVPRLPIRDSLRSPRAWQVAALFTFQNLAYFTVATWLPFLLARSSAAYTAWVFACLNLLPVLPLMLLPVLRWRYSTSRLFYAGNGLMVVAGAVGLALGLNELAWVLALLVGLGCAAAFVGALNLTALVARSDPEAAAVTAVVFTFGYVLAFIGPLLGGWLVDRAQAATTGFWPAIAGGLAMTVLGVLVPHLLAPYTVPEAA